MMPDPGNGAGSGFDHLERHARATPDRIAVTGPGRQVSWGQFHADAARFAHALDQRGVAPGQVVAISHPDRYLHWLLTIACEAIGAVSASFEAQDPGNNAGQVLDLADRVLTERDDWIAGLLVRPAPAADFRRSPIAPDGPLRIIRTSGSTGTQKCLIMTPRMRGHWVEAMTIYAFSTPAARYYPAYSLAVNPVYYRMETCLRVGASVIFGSSTQDILTYRATHCWLLPRDMALLLQGVRGKWPSPEPLHMILGGGPVSPALHDQTAALFGTKVTVVYGANEVGVIALQDREGAGTIPPGVDLKIVDDAGANVPNGAAGAIAVRSSGLAAGYLNDAKTTAAAFRDGWFFTDDIGIRLADGRLRILGRRSEILNLGGLKMAPSVIEDGLRAAIPGIRDIAVTSILNAQGVEEVCIAVVPDGSADPSALLQKIGAGLDPSLGQSWLLPMDSLPIGASGKVQRARLKEIFAAKLKNPA